MIVVADTSVILNLCCVGQQDLLPQLFGNVFIPPEVRQEFDRAVRSYSRFEDLVLPSWLREQAPGSTPEKLREFPGLDSGEVAAISLALELRAHAVLIDEMAGREAAHLCGIVPIGVIGILLQARRAEKLNAVVPILERLRNDANFWIASDLEGEVLKLAGEIPRKNS